MYRLDLAEANVQQEMIEVLDSDIQKLNNIQPSGIINHLKEAIRINKLDAFMFIMDSLYDIGSNLYLNNSIANTARETLSKNPNHLIDVAIKYHSIDFLCELKIYQFDFTKININTKRNVIEEALKIEKNTDVLKWLIENIPGKHVYKMINRNNPRGKTNSPGNSCQDNIRVINDFVLKYEADPGNATQIESVKANKSKEVENFIFLLIDAMNNKNNTLFDRYFDEFKSLKSENVKIFSDQMCDLLKAAFLGENVYYINKICSLNLDPSVYSYKSQNTKVTLLHAAIYKPVASDTLAHLLQYVKTYGETIAEDKDMFFEKILSSKNRKGKSLTNVVERRSLLNEKSKQNIAIFNDFKNKVCQDKNISDSDDDNDDFYGMSEQNEGASEFDETVILNKDNFRDINHSNGNPQFSDVRQFTFSFTIKENPKKRKAEETDEGPISKRSNNGLEGEQSQQNQAFCTTMSNQHEGRERFVNSTVKKI